MYICCKLNACVMYATISADIVSSTSLSERDTIELKRYVEEQLRLIEERFVGSWARLIKGDYIECVVRNPSDAFRIALILKSSLKAFDMSEPCKNKAFKSYGARIAIGIGDMRIVDRDKDIMDGEAIYLSGRALSKMPSVTKGTLTIETSKNNMSASMKVIALLTDALLNDATQKQSQVIYYKLLGLKEAEIAEKMKIYQSGVNTHSTSAKWYCVEEALDYFENLIY